MDSAIYDALVRLSQPWIMRYPLIDFHGNQGAITGDGAAASRYTEARLSPIAEFGMLQNVKTTVDFIPNYDETTVEPISLPALFPNLLCNPNTGIGVAMGSSFAPHNLREVAAAIKAVIRGEEPYSYISGPDFPTGGIIINKDDIPAILKAGRGSVKIRARYKIERGKIVFTEVPYGVTLEGLIDEIDEAVEAGNVVGVADVHDETSKDGIRIVISPVIGMNPEEIVNQLYWNTRLQSSFSYNQRALVNGVPTLLSFKDAIDYYIEFNQNCILREATAEKEKTEARLEVVIGLLKALDIIDEVIALIKASASPAIAKQELIDIFDFTAPQAQAILDMKLSKLAKLESDKLKDEKDKLEKLLIWLTDLIEHKSARLEELTKRLTKLVDTFGDDRLTDVTQIDIKPNIKKETIIPEEVVVIFTEQGYVKRVPRESFRPATRNTKGVKSSDLIKTVIQSSTIDYLLCFSDKGRAYRILVDKVPVGDGRTKGGYIGNYIDLQAGEKILAVTTQASDVSYICFATKKGYIKKTSLDDFKNIRKSGTVAITLTEGDELKSVWTLSDENIFVLADNDKALVFNSENFQSMGKAARGRHGIKLKENESLVAAFALDKSDIVLVSSDGKGKRIKSTDLSPQTPNTIGRKIGENIIAAIAVDFTDNILVDGGSTTICLKVEDLPTYTSLTAKGNALIKDATVKGVYKI